MTEEPDSMPDLGRTDLGATAASMGLLGRASLSSDFMAIMQLASIAQRESIPQMTHVAPADMTLPAVGRRRDFDPQSTRAGPYRAGPLGPRPAPPRGWSRSPASSSPTASSR